MNKKKIILIIIGCFLFVFFMTLFINIYMISSTKDKIINIDKIDNNSNIDTIVVLGCKVEGDVPSLMLARRLDKAIDVYNKLHIKILVTGSHDNTGYNEIDVMKNYLLESGVNPSDIYLDYDGFTTYDSIYRVKDVLKANRVIIITQEYHLYRALFLANKLDLEAFGIVADDIPQKGIMLKNKIREILSRDKNFFKGLLKPKSVYQSGINQYA